MAAMRTVAVFNNSDIDGDGDGDGGGDGLMGALVNVSSTSKGIFTTSNSYSALDDEIEEDVENMYDETANLFSKSGESFSTFMAAVEQVVPWAGGAALCRGIRHFSFSFMSLTYNLLLGRQIFMHERHDQGWSLEVMMATIRTHLKLLSISTHNGGDEDGGGGGDGGRPQKMIIFEMIRTTCTSSSMSNNVSSTSKGIFTTSNSYSASDDEIEEDVENVYDETANLFSKSGESFSTFRTAVG
nr:hypothetical protein [Tanacetum cinerariifolium]